MFDKKNLRAIFGYKFRHDTNVALAARNVNDAYEVDTTKERTVRFWFPRIHRGDLNLTNEMSNLSLRRIIINCEVLLKPIYHERRRS